MPGYVPSALALDDLADISRYIAADRPEAAKRVIAGFFHRFGVIAGQPEIGELRPQFAGGNLRVHAVGNYAIFYRMIGGDVEIAMPTRFSEFR
jgi:plasmid stabilization system protein ParE